MENEEDFIDINAPYNYIYQIPYESDNPNNFFIIQDETKDNFDINNYNHDKGNSNHKNICKILNCPKNCSSKVIQCDNCKGFFSRQFYKNNHQSLCKKLYKEYNEKEAIVECDQCNLKCKVLEFTVHLDKCFKTLDNFKNNTVECKYCNSFVKIQNIEEHEANCQKIKYEMNLIKEQMECEYCKEKFSIFQIELHELNCKMIIDNKERLNEILLNCKVEFPKIWKEPHDLEGSRKIGENINLLNISSDTNEYKLISETLINSLGKFKIKNIKGIYSLRNLILWNKFHMEKLNVEKEKGSANVLDLFYYDINVKSDFIFKNGFDISFADDKAPYGRGIYFNRKSENVIEEAILRNSSISSINYIFLAQVIVGVPYYQSNPNCSIRKPPFLNQLKFIYYDSITNINENKAQPNDNIDQTYVIYNKEKAYPLYYIEFDELIKDNIDIPCNNKRKRHKKEG